ncbi:Arabinanolytic transcriptional activator araR [Cyphellophora attinorum]|uniref:Arabinanolytic transcriptional activator araR n=1 Tax=Cyphellophora attinorum TaxID=1664694 RepID=A0A0N1NZA6_9EURO|nr:Arabinanolytic transcriptional activator araR [Phialophora attinorum]KPI38336.1 Arabinanolytic transcriptional activator araR [Phialophora attinorum]
MMLGEDDHGLTTFTEGMYFMPPVEGKECTYEAGKAPRTKHKSQLSITTDVTDVLSEEPRKSPMVKVLSPTGSSPSARTPQSPTPPDLLHTHSSPTILRLDESTTDQTTTAPTPFTENLATIATPSSTVFGSMMDSDIRAALLKDRSQMSLAQSPYVSPRTRTYTLDPYSYKLPSISDTRSPVTPSSTTAALATCRYPVMQYLAPFLDRDFGYHLACDLLDTYFSSAFSSRLHPTCHHLHNFIVRRCDVLDPLHPRKIHPALLASMLFVASLSDRALGLFNGPEERDRICKYLSLLTYRLLHPARLESLLSQEDLGLPAACLITLPCYTDEDIHRALDPGGLEALPVTWGTDYIITFIHVSSIISGSEKKAASIRWWNVAFNLARDLKLNSEVDNFSAQDEVGRMHGLQTCGCSMPQELSKDTMTEVHREERRRTWWLLFLMDRHLALCYNRPLALLEAECKDLLVPLDDVVWQSGAQPHSHGIRPNGPHCVLAPSGTGRSNGPPVTCTGFGLFQYFLPLMTITGHLLEFNRAKSHPVLLSASAAMWSSQERQILSELEHYQTSLDAIATLTDDATQRPSLGGRSNSWLQQHPTAGSVRESSERAHIAKIVSAYARHVMSVLRILVGSKWDPVQLFEDADFWTSSGGFKESMSHTITASECVTQILELDPDLSFMPYFFGIQLLHGSLLLLLVAYRLQADSGSVILTACEAVVRATESCFVTLPTDYQRQFRNVMRSAIALARGRGDRTREGETEKQLASVLARYRWSRNGGGLAR